MECKIKRKFRDFFQIMLVWSESVILRHGIYHHHLEQPVRPVGEGDQEHLQEPGAMKGEVKGVTPGK